MTTIKNLSATDKVAASDLLPIWSAGLGDARKISAYNLQSYIFGDFLSGLLTSAGSALIGASQAVNYASGTLGAAYNLRPSVTDAPWNADSTGVASAQAAFLSAAASARRVRVPAGTYNLTADVTGNFEIDAGVTFNGAGRVKLTKRGKYIDTGGVNIHRIRDRLFVGDATDNAGAFNPTLAQQSWVGNLTGYGVGYFERDAVVSAISGMSGNALFGASRTSDGQTYGTPTKILGQAIGVMGLAVADETTLLDFNGFKPAAWGAYFEVHRETNGGGAQGIEVEVVNHAADTFQADPYNGLTSHDGQVGISVSGGAEVNNDIDITVGYLLGNNGARFKKGFVFMDNAIRRDGNGFATAVEMSTQQCLTWKFAGGETAIAGKIYSTNNNVDQRTVIDFSANGLTIKGRQDEREIAVFGPVASSVNFFVFQPTTTGGVLLVRPNSTGGDPNCPIALRSKGTSSAVLQSGDGTNKVTANNTGVGFFGASPVARQTYGAPTGGAADRTTFDTTTVTTAQLAQRVRAMIDDFRSLGLFA